MSKYIFITGGVYSSLGKGIIASSIAVLLKSLGYNSILLKKIDPYININPGNMNPDQHGEVYVTYDGGETDLDLGHYERFTSITTSKDNNITAGQIYLDIINREAQGYYSGETIQVNPHVTNRINEFILHKDEVADFQIIEIGGTVGDIECLPFLEAICQIKKSVDSILFIHVTLVPTLTVAEEIKTKPTQHSVSKLRSLGIDPDILICRSAEKLDDVILTKLSSLCGLKRELVITCPDVSVIYQVPSLLKLQDLDRKIIELSKGSLCRLDCGTCQQIQAANVLQSSLPELTLLQKLNNFMDKLHSLEQVVSVVLIGKYQSYDVYRSIYEALLHAGVHCGVKVKINFAHTDNLNIDELQQTLQKSSGVIIAGGFGSRGVSSKLFAIQVARENNIPILGICYGMQLMAVEFACNVLNIADANTTEINPDTQFPIVQVNVDGKMYLGSHYCQLVEGSMIYNIYNTCIIYERHRHRYCINTDLFKQLESQGLIASAFYLHNAQEQHEAATRVTRPRIIEALELKGHPWFIGVQYHPEFQSSPFECHLLFKSFIQALL